MLARTPLTDHVVPMPSFRLVLPAFGCLVVSCSSTSASRTDAGTPGPDAAGAVRDAPADVADAIIDCPGALPDAGFTSLDDLPVAQLCAESGAGGYGAGVVEETTTPCDGSILVQSPMETDCGAFWLFDATTHALQAIGGQCNGSYGCSGAVPGFRFPSECFEPSWQWGSSGIELCPDAGPPGAVDGGDAAPEAASD